MPSKKEKAVSDLAGAIRPALATLLEDEALSGDPEADLELVTAALASPSDLQSLTLHAEGRTFLAVYLTHSASEKAVANLVRQITLFGPGGISRTKKLSTAGDVVQAVIGGHVALLSQIGESFLVPAARRPKTSVAKAERVVRGQNAAVPSKLDDAVMALRGAIPSRDLRFVFLKVGLVTRTPTALIYLSSRMEASEVEEVRARVSSIQLTGVVDASQLAPSLSGPHLALLPLTQPTERLDTTIFALLRGRIVVIVDGAPTALIFPTTLHDLMSSPEDNYLPPLVAAFVRVLRYGGGFVALISESLFIGLVSVNQDLLPTPLAFAIARSRASVPLPAFLEVIIMAVVVEVLREAAVRLPSSLSQTIAIVGALVLGQAVVQAQLISAPVIVVVSLTALASFLVPSYELAVSLRLLRFPAMLFAALFGVTGLDWYLVVILAHAARIRSAGVPFFLPAPPSKERARQRSGVAGRLAQLLGKSQPSTP